MSADRGDRICDGLLTGTGVILRQGLTTSVQKLPVQVCQCWRVDEVVHGSIDQGQRTGHRGQIELGRGRCSDGL